MLMLLTCLPLCVRSMLCCLMRPGKDCHISVQSFLYYQLCLCKCLEHCRGSLSGNTESDRNWIPVGFVGCKLRN